MPAVSVWTSVNAERYATFFSNDGGPTFRIRFARVGVLGLAVTSDADVTLLGRRLPIERREMPSVADRAKIRREVPLIGCVGIESRFPRFAFRTILGEGLPRLFAGAGFTFRCVAH